MEESETCPRCKTSKYNKPSMRLMINVCAHVICESCVEQLFFRGSGACPKCNKIIKKADFRDQIYDDCYIEKEVVIRKKIMKDLTKTEQDFLNLREFNDYLETVETIIFNLANNIDEEDSIKKVGELKAEAKEASKNKHRINADTTKENPLYIYKELVLYNHGPNLPPFEEILNRYSPNVMIDATQIACGFPQYVPIQRLLSDSFSDLYLSVKPYPV